MHGKAQRDPAQRAASSTLTKFLASASTRRPRHLANMIKPKCVANVSLLLGLSANFKGCAKKLANRSQPFVGQSSPNLEACRGVPVN